MKQPLAFLLALAVIFPATTAMAVDIANEDDALQTVLVSDGTGDREIEVEPKALVSDACQKCTITMGDDALEVEGDVVVSIIGGKLIVN